jgi:hypothetical protein
VADWKAGSGSRFPTKQIGGGFGCVAARKITDATRSSTGVVPIGSDSPQVTGHDARPKRREFYLSDLFQGESNDLPKQATISLYDSPRGKGGRKPVLKFKAVTQAFAVYPEQPKLINGSTLIKLEGTYGDERMCANMKRRKGWMLLMPNAEDAKSGEMLKWLIGEHVPFDQSF